MAPTAPALIDTHFHLDLHPRAEELASKIQKRGIKTIAVTNTPSVFHYTFRLSQKHDSILPAIGLHPELAPERQLELPKLREWLKRTRFVGEVGLDYVSADNRIRSVQRGVFQSILSACAEYGDKILTVHSRRSSGDVIAAIGESFPGKIILHWYSGSKRDLDKGVDYGFYFSVNSAMLRSASGRNLIARIPHERILTETDGPFVKIGTRPATPLHMPETVQSLAALWSMSEKQAARELAWNFSVLLSRFAE